MHGVVDCVLIVKPFVVSGYSAHPCIVHRPAESALSCVIAGAFQLSCGLKAFFYELQATALPVSIGIRLIPLQVQHCIGLSHKMSCDIVRQQSSCCLSHDSKPKALALHVPIG